MILVVSLMLNFYLMLLRTTIYIGRRMKISANYKTGIQASPYVAEARIEEAQARMVIFCRRLARQARLSIRAPQAPVVRFHQPGPSYTGVSQRAVYAVLDRPSKIRQSRSSTGGCQWGQSLWANHKPHKYNRAGKQNICLVTSIGCSCETRTGPSQGSKIARAPNYRSAPLHQCLTSIAQHCNISGNVGGTDA